ncbi:MULTISPECIES: site-specific integrase [unclassified Rhodococcus (in: high G+C Gram-positive bacteria)]|uniref:site-specific integrase n=1 Tax=unclassified Rhodococcus (in: high G+C Gram-positive bacteria) TaxID=192944 RepID=UPI0015F3A2E0|nr:MULTISPECIES: site-specific integrase [unclassified Rhodococcus (in: high G+C Gram-positive bacteria)]MDI9946379.1 tyrosine-type recombinase/integrase [Rhodococcus sp. IEGM 1302]
MATVSEYATKAGTRYEVRYRTPDHQTTRKRGFKTKRDANAYAARVEVDKQTGAFVLQSAGRATIGELGVEWLGRQAHLKPSSARVVKSAWDNHVQPKWGQTPVGRVKRTHVQQWVADMSVDSGPVTITRCFGVLASILDDAVADRLLVVNPARGVKLPRRKRGEQTYLTMTQLQALAEQAGERRGLVLLLGFGGLRFGEAAGLRVRHLDLLRRRVRVVENAVTVAGRVELGSPKSHAQRTIAVPRLVAEALARQCEGKGRDDIVFPNVRGGHMTLPSGKSWWSGAVERCQADDPNFPQISVHALRHTAASLMIAAGANPKAIQAQLGHASATLTMDRYGHLFADQLGDLADALDAAAAESVSKACPEDSPEAALG